MEIGLSTCGKRVYRLATLPSIPGQFCNYSVAVGNFKKSASNRESNYWSPPYLCRICLVFIFPVGFGGAIGAGGGNCERNRLDTVPWLSARYFGGRWTDRL